MTNVQNYKETINKVSNAQEALYKAIEVYERELQDAQMNLKSLAVEQATSDTPNVVFVTAIAKQEQMVADMLKHLNGVKCVLC